MNVINLNLYQSIEVFNLQHGLYSPLDRFIFPSELDDILSYDLFPLPILLTVDKETFNNIEGGEKVDLVFSGKKVAELEVEGKEVMNPKEFALKLYQRRDHPGIELFVRHHSPYAISGKVKQEKRISLEKEFKNRGWKSVVAFQTRNIPHIGHERVQKYGLSLADGLLLTPVLGIKNPGDFKNKVIEEAYKTFYRTAYTEDEAMLHFIFLNMRYLGGREAAFHAVVRRNLGATHFVVGRDHAGVKDIYAPYEAQEEVMSLDLGIEIIPVKEVLYCGSCSSAVFEEECGHPKTKISGSKIREALKSGRIEEKFLRREVAETILKFNEKFVDEKGDADYLEERLLREWDGRRLET